MMAGQRIFKQTKLFLLELSATAALLAISYKHDRAIEYPTIEECIHAILDDDLTALQVLRQAVKDKYPKP